jgi:hypothetical protein
MTISDLFRSLFRRRSKPSAPSGGELPNADDVIAALFFNEAAGQESHHTRTRRIVDDLSFGTLGGVSFFIPSRRK